MQRRTVTVLLTSLALAATAFAANAADQTFSNPGQVTINDNAAASPYPSTIDVSGLNGDITGATVTLHGISHTFIGDLRIILVAPNGAKIGLIQRPGIAPGPSTCCGYADNFSNSEITFSATAATPIMTASNTDAIVPNGSYLPTIGNSQNDAPAPAPAGPYSSDMSILNGTAASQAGPWQLFVSDGINLDSGQISGGWSLTLSGANLSSTTCASEGYTGLKLTWCKNICESDLSGGALDGWIRRWVQRYHTLPYCAIE